MRSTIRDATNRANKNQGFPQVVSPKNGNDVITNGYPSIGQPQRSNHPSPIDQAKTSRPAMGAPQIRKAPYNMNFAMGAGNGGGGHEGGSGQGNASFANESKFGSKRASNS